jgi:hypothetical protein
MKYCRLCGELIDYGEDMVDGMHEQCYDQVSSQVEHKLMEEYDEDVAVVIDLRRK